MKEMLLHDCVKEAARTAVKLGLSKEAFISIAGTLFDTCQKRKQEKQERKQEKDEYNKKNDSKNM